MQHTRLTTAEFVGHLEKGCPHLEVLEVSLYGGFCSPVLLLLLRVFVSLHELVLHGLKEGMIAEVAAALPNIKRLTITGFYHTIGPVLKVFEDCQIHYVGLEYLSVNGFVHARKPGGSSRLELPRYLSTNVFSTHLSRILNNCGSLESLVWWPTLDREMVTLLADKFDETLTSLTLRTDRMPLLRKLLTKCSRSLTSLSVLCSTCPLALVASTCPHLVSLSLSGCVPTEDGLAALSVGCVDLQELTIGTSNSNTEQKQSLLSVIALKLRLRLLNLREAFDEADAAWYCQRANELQLLPVPMIVVVK